MALKVWGRQAFGVSTYSREEREHPRFSCSISCLVMQPRRIVYPWIHASAGSKASSHSRNGVLGPDVCQARKELAQAEKFCDMILQEVIPPLESTAFPDPDALTHLEKYNTPMFSKLNSTLLPSAWIPFEKIFIDKENGGGVYSIIGLNRGFNQVKIRVGQAEKLEERLRTHLAGVRGEFPQGIVPIFYSPSHVTKKKLNMAEQSIFHLVPKKHPTD